MVPRALTAVDRSQVRLAYVGWSIGEVARPARGLERQQVVTPLAAKPTKMIH